MTHRNRPFTNPSTRDIGQHVHDWESALRFLGGKDEKALAHNTLIYVTEDAEDQRVIAVRFHRTEIVTYYRDGRIRLDSGGYQSVTTKQRMNQLLPSWVGVVQRKGDWYVENSLTREKVPFKDGMVVSGEVPEVRRNPRKRSEYPPVGIISEGTLRVDDLGDAYASFLESYGNAEHRDLVREWEGLDEDARESEEADGIVEEMADAIQNIAPPYSYFGSSEGDGALIGIWPDLDSLEEDARGRDAEVLKVSDTADVPDDYSGYVMQVSDHGNVTLYESSHGRLTEVWSVV